MTTFNAFVNIPGTSGFDSVPILEGDGVQFIISANGITIVNTGSAGTGGGGASVSDAAYDQATWDAVADVAPSKNAVRDKIQSMYADFDAAGDAAAAVAAHEGASDPHSQYLTAAEGNAAYQPLAAQLTVWAGVTSTADGRSLVSAADYAAMRALLDLEAGTDFYSTSAADALLAAKAPLASPTFTGTPAAPTATPGTNTTQIATTEFVTTAVAAISTYTDEQAQDAVGAMVDSSLVYTDGTPLLQRAALTGDVTADAGSNATTVAKIGGVAVTVDTDGTLAANSDAKLATQKAVKTYSDAKVDDTAYDATSWNSVTGVAPSKNAVRDKIEALVAAGTAYPTGHVYGFLVAWASSTTVTVSPPPLGASVCRDKSDTANISLTTTQTINTATHNAINGDDSKTGTGTVSSTNGSATVTGSGTNFLTAFGARTLTGTLSTSGTSCTGSSTKFMSEVAVGDLIGTDANGYSQVASIASDTALTLGVAIPGGNLSGGTTAKCIENPTVQVGSDLVVQVLKIASDTSLTMTNNATNDRSGVAWTYGKPFPDQSTIPGSGNAFAYIWVGTGGTGTGVYISTQRTTSYGITGYDTNKRRLDSLFGGGGGAIYEFSKSGVGAERTTQYEFAVNTNGTRVLSAGTATSWTAISFAAVAPPTAHELIFTPSPGNLNGGQSYFRKRNAGSATATRSLYASNTSATVFNSTQMFCRCDGAGYIDYANSSGTLQLYVDAVGYKEIL